MHPVSQRARHASPRAAASSAPSSFVRRLVSLRHSLTTKSINQARAQLSCCERCSTTSHGIQWKRCDCSARVQSLQLWAQRGAVCCCVHSPPLLLRSTLLSILCICLVLGTVSMQEVEGTLLVCYAPLCICNSHARCLLRLMQLAAAITARSKGCTTRATHSGTAAWQMHIWCGIVVHEAAHTRITQAIRWACGLAIHGCLAMPRNHA